MEDIEHQANELYSESFGRKPSNALVNINTGTLNYNYTIGTIYNGVDKNNPAFSLSIYYTQGEVKAREGGFFVGWNFNVPYIDFYNNNIMLSNGFSGEFEIVNGELGGELKLVSHKLLDIKIQIISENEVRAFHKNGTVEVFIDSKLMFLIDQFGRQVIFDYDVTGQLLSIYSNNNTYSRINFSYRMNTIEIEEHSGDSVNKTDLIYQPDDNGGLLSKILCYFGNDIRTTEFTFYLDDTSGLLVNTIISSESENIEIEYSELPWSSEKKVKVISALTLIEDDSLSSVERYEYSYPSGNNYTGYEAGFTPTPGKDNCIYKMHEYNYVVKETLPNGIQKFYTFNKFHLLNEVNFLTERNETYNELYFYGLTTGNIKDQKTTYNLITKTITTKGDMPFLNKAIDQRFSYDEYGNILSKSNGEYRTDYTYYPIDSTLEEGCPPHPDGLFVCYVKLIEKYKINNNSQTEREQFLYDSYEGLTVSQIENREKLFIAPIEYKKNDITLRKVNYFDTNFHSMCLGQVKEVIHFHNSYINELEDTLEKYSYDFHNSYVVVNRKVHYSKGEKYSSSTISLSQHMSVVKEIGFDGVVSIYHYDGFDRLTRKVRLLSSQSTTEYLTYAAKSLTRYGTRNVIYHSMPTGLKINYYYLASGKLTHITIGEKTNETLIKEIKYDFDDVSSITSYDSSIKYIEIHTNFENGLFGLSKVSYNSNHNESIKYDFSNENSKVETIRGNDGAVIQEIKKDSEDKILSFGAPYYPTDTYLYDRAIEGPTIISNAYGAVTNNTYDEIGRLIIKEVVDEVTIKYSYQSTSFDSLCGIEIIDSKNITTKHFARDFDSFGRVIKEGEWSGSTPIWRKYFEYSNDHQAVPSKVYASNGLLLKEVKTDAFTGKVTEEVIYQIPGGNEKLKYKYLYDTLGNCLASEELEFRADGKLHRTSLYEYLYDDFGHLRSSNIDIGGKTYSLEQHRTLSGRYTFVKNHLGYIQNYFYSSLGELVKKEYHGVHVNISADYDEQSNIRLITLTIGSPEVWTFKINFTRDSTGRATKIDNILFDSKVSTIHEVSLEYEYDVWGNISRRKVYRNGVLINNDSYRYEGAEPKVSQVTDINNSSETHEYYTKNVKNIFKDSNSLEFNRLNDQIVSLFKDNKSIYSVNYDFLNNLTDLYGEGESYWMNYDFDHRVVSSESEAYARYFYNPSKRISSIELPNSKERIDYLYLGEVLIGEVSNLESTLYLTFGSLKLGRVINSGTSTSFEIFCIDAQNSVLSVLDINSDNVHIQNFGYDIYGNAI